MTSRGLTASRSGISRPALATMATVGVAGLTYAWCEARWFTLHEVTIPCLPAESADVRALHLTDVHLTPYQGRKIQWLRSLAALEPDLIVDTGDNIAHRDAWPVFVDAMGPLMGRPGVFVLGSNDYYEPGVRNPFSYLLPDRGKRHVGVPQLPWQEMAEAFRNKGWLDLTNTLGALNVNGVAISFAGVDDPHLKFDDLAAVSGPADAAADLRLGIAHAPYLRVLDQFAADGYDAVLAGHTHGGQLQVPGYGALVTNCDLEPARANGLHRHPAASSPGEPGSNWLHVSSGAGTSPYAVIRFCCRPSATLVRFTQAA